MKYDRMQLILFGQYIFKNYPRAKVNLRNGVQNKHLNRYMESTSGNIEILPPHDKSLLNAICVEDFSGQYTYLQLYESSKRLSIQISNLCGSGSGSTVSFFCSNDILTMVILWASWLSGQKAFTLKRDLSLINLSNLVKETKTRLIISPFINDKQSQILAFENIIPLIHIDHKFLKNFNTELPEIAQRKVFHYEFYNIGALYFNTKKIGETKLVNHKALGAKIKDAVKLWSVAKNDKILYICPSFQSCSDEYIFNLLFPLSVGSQLHILEPFDSKDVWRIILGTNLKQKERFSALIAEPKVYEKLILEYDKMFAADKRIVEYIKEYCLQNIRFMMSCFYPADNETICTWLKITGHCLQASDYSNDNLIQMDAFDEKANLDLPTNTYSKFRIVDAKNNLLLEIPGTQIKKRSSLSPPLTIGRLAVSNDGTTFCYTGEIVSYCNGVFNKIGQYNEAQSSYDTCNSMQ